MKETRILLDSDFCNMLTEINSAKIDSCQLLDNIFAEIKKEPFIHEYLDKNELFNNEVIKQFIAAGKIKVLKYKEITNNDEYKSFYEDTFEEYFYTMNDECFSVISPSIDCFSFRKSGCNLGEIHSLIAARFLGIPILYSNDGGAKMLAGKYNR